MYEIEYPEGDPFVHARWRAEVVEAGAYLDPANEYWGIAVTEAGDGSLRVELVGPAPAPRTLVGVLGERHWGIEFHPQVIVAGIDKADALGLLVPFDVDGRRFRLDGVWHPVPSWSELSAFVASWVAEEILTVDADAQRALEGDLSGWSLRSWQRRIKAATGVTASQIAQFSRARAAAEALQEGRSATEVAAELGYADQAHLTRSLVALRAERPSELRRRRS